MKRAANYGLLGERLDRDGAPMGDEPENDRVPPPTPCEIVDERCRVHGDPECLTNPIRRRRR